ncbi:MAG: hypothetical protein ABIO43_06395 [Sphingomicrobium sp.]
MSGYREHGFDPNPYERQGPARRPFNWVQWVGLALAMLAAAIYLVYAAGRAGWMPALIDSPMPVASLTVLAVALINSRRNQPVDLAPELAAARRRWMIITLAICTVVLGAAVAIEFTGA